MAAFETMLSMAVMFTLLAVPGILLGKRGLIQKEGMLTLSNILLYAAMPFLVLSQLMQTEPGDLSPVGLLLSIVIPMVLILSVLRRKRPVFSYCVAFSNCGFLGIPLASAVFPETSAVAVYVSVYNVVSSLLIWTVGAYVMSGDKSSIRIRNAVFNPVTVFCVLGIFFCWLRTAEYMPRLVDYARTLANLTTPLSMTVMGYELSQSEPVEIFTDRRVYLASLQKLILLPAVVCLVLMALGRWLDQENAALLPAMLIASAMPTAATAPAMSEKYGADSVAAARITLGTTILSVVTLPVMFLIFGRFFPT